MSGHTIWNYNSFSITLNKSLTLRFETEITQELVADFNLKSLNSNYPKFPFI